MINILIPMAGKNKFFPIEEYPFPLPLMEINGVTLIEKLVRFYSLLSEDIRFTFLVLEEDCRKFYLDKTLKLLTNDECEVIKIGAATKGSLCSILLAKEIISTSDKLIISNFDQFLKIDINKVLEKYSGYEGGVLTFNSVHPRWSYVKVDEENLVVESSEKKPISKNAIAGFYYFSRGDDFIKFAEESIYKTCNQLEDHYVSQVINEYVLSGKKILNCKISNENYVTLYSPERIQDYRSQAAKE